MDLVENYLKSLNETDNRSGKFLNYSLAANFAGPIGMAVYYHYRKISDTCHRKCRESKETHNEDCIKQCNVVAANHVLNNVYTEYPKCKSTSNPEKCQRKLERLRNKWVGIRQRYLKSETK